jgi:hypothetical protein
MNDDLKRDMARDMGIVRFENETEESFNQRLIYSAGAEWVKTLVYGNSYADIANLKEQESNYTNVDIMYIKTHLSTVIEAYLQMFPISKTWFNEENLSISQKASRWAGRIIRDTINTYNIAENESRRMTPVPTSIYQYGEKAYLLRGEQETVHHGFNVGVAKWKLLQKEPEIYDIDTRIINVKVSDYYKILDEQAKWKNVDLRSQYLRFKLGTTGAYSRAWIPCKLSDIKPADGIVVLKMADEYNGGYFMVKNENQNLLAADLDPWYTSSREIYRILYALNFHNGIPAEFKVEQYADHMILNMHCAVPDYENRIIMNCSWPASSYHSLYQRIIPQMLWEVVKETLDYLNIKIVYL